VLAATNTRALWYLTRGTGLVCLLLLTASVVLGILEAKRWASPRWPRFITAGLHKNISLLVLAFLAVHITTAVVDSFAPIGWLDAVVPFISTYRPIWLGLGALAVDLLIAITVTSLLRPRLGYPAWRAVHWLTYLCWPVALVHGLGTGTDVRQRWVLLITLLCLAAVLGAVWWRLAGGPPERAGVRAAAAAVSVVAPLVLLGWLVTGPLHSGWAARAGTPAALLASGGSGSSGAASSPTTTAPPGTSSPAPSSTGLQAPFSASLTGTLATSGPDASGNTTITINGTLSAGASGTLHIQLQGPTDAEGGVQMASSAVTIGPLSRPSLYSGQITRLRGTEITAVVTDSANGSMTLRIALQIDQTNTRVTGTVQATAGAAG
jgi:sulfoxide reductase heme-binding subunit YedZ